MPHPGAGDAPFLTDIEQDADGFDLLVLTQQWAPLPELAGGGVWNGQAIMRLRARSRPESELRADAICAA